MCVRSSLPCDPTFNRRRSRQAADLDLAAELRRAVRPADEGRRESVRTPLALSWLVGRLVDDLRDDRQRRSVSSQIGFLHLLEGGLAYQLEAPTLWDVDFRTASRRPSWRIASAKGRITGCGSIAGRRRHRDRDHASGTTAGVRGLVAHPDDERYKPLFGKDVLTPLFRARVPVMAHGSPTPRRAAASR